MRINVAALFLLLLKFSLAAAESSNISNALRPYVERHELAGAVTLVASKDKILSLEAVGYADIAAKKAMQTDAIFWVASMSKPVTAAALMMLVDAGKIDLDDPVQRYLPHFDPKIMVLTEDGNSVQLQSPQHPITVRNLLSHTSGLPFSSSIEKPTLDVFPLAVGVKSYSLEPLRFEPGGDYQYSNAGINTAGRIIEVVSGMSYADFLQKRLFKPLEMTDTTFWPTKAQLSRLAKSYRPDASWTNLEETPVTQLHYPLDDRRQRHPMPAGGLFSTAVDMAKFCQLFLNGGTVNGKRYLSLEAIQEMTHSQLDPDHQSGAAAMMKIQRGYGLGWETSASGAYGHGGAYSTHMYVDPEHGLATVWMVQHAGFPGEGGKSRAAFEAAVAKQFISEEEQKVSQRAGAGSSR